MSRNAFRAVCLAALAVAVVLFAPPSRAGTTGKLAGRITNEKREPLAGVNIRLEGVRLGAASDEQGNYFIIGIPAGTYTVRANLLGQAPYVADNVQIAPDFTTTLNIAMRTEAIQLAEVRVEAERPLLQKDATGTTRFISAQDMQKLPTRGYRDAAAKQTGVVNFKLNIDTEAQNSPTLIVRGGRPNETAYYVDGFSQQDPLTGTSNTAISNNAVQEMVVMTGGFNAEYGRVMSGAVNVITREGAKKYFGALESVTDAVSGGWLGTRRIDYNVYDASLGGPVVPGKEDLTFYVSSERRWNRDRGPTFLSDLFKNDLESRSLSGDFLPNNSSSGWTFQGKLNWQPSDQVTVKAGGLGSQEVWSQYLNSYLFNLAHTPRYLDRSQSYFSSFNQVLSPRTFYNLAVNYNLTQRKRGDGVAFDNLDPRYEVVGRDSVGVDGEGNTRYGDMLASENDQLLTPGGYYRVADVRFDQEVPMFWNDDHVWNDYMQRRSEYWGFQGALTSQVNTYHQIKAGGDFQHHTLRYFDHYFPVQLGGENANQRDWDGYGYRLDVTYKDVVIRDVTDGDTTYRITRVADRASLVQNGDESRDGPKHPKVWSLYAQDKFEREGIVINGGLRFDHLNVDTPALRNELRPLDPYYTRSDTLDAGDLVKNRTYSRFSPRLGIAFPVTTQTILRFNYGQFYQQPNLQDLYVSYRFLEYKIKKSGYFVGFGNPNLRPELTTAYEVGVAHQLGNNVRLDVTAYYKDVKDLVEITTIPSSPNQFASYRNRDFATIKGVDIGFKMRPINRISADVSYSLSYAQGTGSVSNTQGNIAWYAAQTPKMTAPLSFDQRHKLAIGVDYSLGKGEGPALGRWKPFQNLGVNVLYNVASGTPYTPTRVFNEVTLAAVSSRPDGPINSRYGPWTSDLDIKASRSFSLMGLNCEAYAWVLNVLDTRNSINVYGSTGSASSTGWLFTEDGQNYLATAAAAGRDGQMLYELAQNNPNFYSNPRLVRFGFRTNF